MDIEGCLEVLRLARRYQRHVVVCHVLRYTKFYGTLYELRVTVADGGNLDLSETAKEIKVSVVIGK